MSVRRLVRSLGTWLSVGTLLFVVMAPFGWVFSSSFKPTRLIIASTPTLLPVPFVLEHYVKLLRASPYLTYLANSTVVALLTMVIVVSLASPAAYALYRLRFPGRDYLLRIVLITYAFPRMLLMIPFYTLFTRVRLVDTLQALVLVNVTFAAPFGVWMLRAFFQAIPREIEEAAALDGATRLQTLTRIMVPLTAPGVASVAMFAFVASWTEYMFASFLINSDSRRTIPVGLAALMGQYDIDWGLLLAGATLTSLPVLILFAFVGQAFVRGLTAGAVK